MNPELDLECHETAAFVVDRLREFGVDEIHEGFAQSGVVAVIKGQLKSHGAVPTIGLRADMDALPIQEDSNADWASTVPGVMHACGHDGHMAMLLGAARYLAETRNFSGRAVLLFQPAEELSGGGQIMVEEGVMERFGIDEVYALHTAPFAKLGSFETRIGTFSSSIDDFEIIVRGQGGHAAMPAESKDPIVPALVIGQALQSISARNIPSFEEVVISLTCINAGEATNIIPDRVRLAGTVRCLSPKVRALAERRVRAIAEAQAVAFDVEIDVSYTPYYPSINNHEEQTLFAASIAESIVGIVNVDANAKPMLGGEDFAYMLEARPGCFLFIGQGEGPSLHNPMFDFNDDIAPLGAALLARLVEKRTLKPTPNR